MKSADTPGQSVEHVSLMELAELAEAGASTRGLLLAIFRHLAALCPQCGDELAPLLGRLQAAEVQGRSEEDFFASLLKAAWAASAERGEENWHALAEEMLRLTAEERDALWHCDPRTHQLALGLALLELGESRLGSSPLEAKQAAEQVLALIERRATDPPLGHPGLESLAADHAAQAFALLAQVELTAKNTESAAGPLLAARAAAEQGTGDPEVAAAVGMAEALLLWVRGRWRGESARPRAGGSAVGGGGRTGAGSSGARSPSHCVGQPGPGGGSRGGAGAGRQPLPPCRSGPAHGKLA